MVSTTSQTRNIRQSKHKKMGRKRKNTLANQGSTRSQEELFGGVPASETKKAS